jgi:hypothetical protein
MADLTLEDIDDLCMTVRDSMFADDRQTRAQLQGGLDALSTLQRFAEEALRARESVDLMRLAEGDSDYADSLVAAWTKPKEHDDD